MTVGRTPREVNVVANKDENAPRKAALGSWLWITILLGAAILIGVWWLAR